MKKATKAAVVCGSAAIVLAGGAGSFAAFTSSTPSTGGGTTTSGGLTVTPVGNPTWTWKSVANDGTVAVGSTFNPATQTLVPGDSIQVIGTFKLGITGTGLKATATVVNGAGSNLGQLTFTPAPLSGTVGNVNALTTADNGKTVTAGGVLTFPSSAVATMDQTTNVSDLKLTVTQQ